MQASEKSGDAIKVEEILCLWWRKLWLILLAAALLAGAAWWFTPKPTGELYVAQQDVLALENRVWESMLYPDLKAARTVMLGNTVLAETIQASGLKMTEEDLRHNLSVTAADNALLRVQLWADTPEKVRKLTSCYLDAACRAVEETLETMDLKPSGEPVVRRWVQADKSLRNGLIGGGAGALLMALFLLYRELFDRRVKDEKSAARCTGLPVLAVVPELRSDRGRRRAAPHPLDGKDLPAAYTEAWRSLRVNLDARLTEETWSLLLAGAGKNEDAANAAVNLAITMGRGSKKVILVDCDLSGCPLNAYLPEHTAPGMKELLAGKAKAADCVKESPWQGVYVIPAGAADAPVPDLTAGGLPPVLEALEADCDLLLVIGPAAALSADAAALAAQTDGALLVLRARNASEETVKLASDKLSAAGGKLLGCVLTRLDPRRVYSRNGYTQSFRLNR